MFFHNAGWRRTWSEGRVMCESITRGDAHGHPGRLSARAEGGGRRRLGPIPSGRSRRGSASSSGHGRDGQGELVVDHGAGGHLRRVDGEPSARSLDVRIVGRERREGRAVDGRRLRDPQGRALRDGRVNAARDRAPSPAPGQRLVLDSRPRTDPSAGSRAAPAGSRARPRTARPPCPANSRAIAVALVLFLLARVAVLCAHARGLNMSRAGGPGRHVPPRAAATRALPGAFCRADAAATARLRVNDPGGRRGHLRRRSARGRGGPCFEGRGCVTGPCGGIFTLSMLGFMTDGASREPREPSLLRSSAHLAWIVVHVPRFCT